MHKPIKRKETDYGSLYWSRSYWNPLHPVPSILPDAKGQELA